MIDYSKGPGFETVASVCDDAVARQKSGKLTDLWHRWARRADRWKSGQARTVSHYVYHRREAMHARLTGYIESALKHEAAADRIGVRW